MTIRSTSTAILLVMFLAMASMASAQSETVSDELGEREYRTWTDSTGRYRIEAALVGYAEGNLRLLKRNGKTISVPLKALSLDDRQYLRKELARRKAQAAGPRDKPQSTADWPGWQGPNRDGKSPDTGLLKQWPAGGPKLLWKISNIGKGYSSVAVVDGTIYTSGVVDGALAIFALDLDGKTRWQVAHGSAFTKSYPGSRATPMIDEGNLYLMSGTGLLRSYSAKTGKPNWSREMSEFGGRVPGWGYAESVLILKNLAIVTPGGANCIVALDKASGRPAWSSQGFKAGAQYGSCIAFSAGGSTLVAAGTHEGLVCVDAQNGRLQWSNPFSAHNTANCPTPAYADGHVFWATGYGKGGICMKLAGGRGKVSASPAWTTGKMNCHHGGYVIHEGHVYGNNGNGWACLELKTGRVKWEERAVGKGSVCWADDMLYLFGERKGRRRPGHLLPGRPRSTRHLQRRRRRPKLGPPRRHRRPIVPPVRYQPLLLRRESAVAARWIHRGWPI